MARSHKHQDLVEQANSLFVSRYVEPEEDILEILRSLEEVNEESFPYYTLVRWLRTNIENHLEDSIDSSGVSSNAAWKAAARDAYNNIMETPEMVSVLESIRNGDSPEILARDLSMLNVTPSESDGSMEDLWWAPTVLPQQYQQLAEDISVRKPPQIRIDSLRILLSSHLSLEGPHWQQLRRGLKEALCDENELVFQLGLRIHAKLLLSPTAHFAIKESFLNLLESVSTQYMSRKLLPIIPTIESGIDLSKPLHFRLMKILKLISDSQTEITKEWIRFSPRKVEEMIESFIDLISMHTYDGLSREKYLYPFHLLSAIDNYSNWSVHWTHAVFSRNLLIRALSRSSPFLKFAVDCISKWMENFDPVQFLTLKTNLTHIKKNLNCAIMPGCIVQYTVFINCINLLQCILPFDAGRALFTSVQPAMSLSSLASLSVDFLNNHAEEIGALSITLTKFVSCFLPKLADTPLLLMVLQPMLEAHSDRGQETTYPLPVHNVKLVQVLVSSEEGIRCLIGGRRPRGSFRHRSSQENLSCLARTLAEYLTAVLKSHKNADLRLLDAVLSVCSSLRLTHDMLLYLDSSGLFYTLNNFYKFIKTKLDQEMYSSTKISPYSYASILRRLVQCYLPIFKTPKGVYYLERDGILHDVLQDIFEQNLVNLQRPEDRLLVFRACNYSSGARAVLEERIVTEQLARVCNDDRDETVTILASLCDSLNSVQLQLDEKPGSDETLLANEGPRSLAELLEVTLLEDDDAMQHLGLSLLCHLINDLDVTLILQHRFLLQDRLLQRQKENSVSKDGTVIIDELSVLRNHILVQLLVSGGPGERVIPPATCDTNEFPWPLFSALPVPREYLKTSGRGSSKRQQGELHRFLADTRPGVHDAQWLLHCRRAAKTSLQAQDDVKGSVLLDLVKQVLRASPNTTILLGTVVTEQPFPEEALGISIAIRYGAQLRLIQAAPVTHDNLAQLLRLSRALKPSRVERFTGFDWFVASVFLSLGGNVERSHGFLQSLASLRWAPLVWPSLAERCRICSKIESTLAHFIELILSTEDPQLLLALQRKGISAGFVVCSWIRRCFWGVLDWPAVTQWLLLAVLTEPDVVIYLGVAMLRHVRTRFMMAKSQVTCLDRFNIGDVVPYIETLTKRYRYKVLPHLQTALTI